MNSGCNKISTAVPLAFGFFMSVVLAVSPSYGLTSNSCYDSLSFRKGTVATKGIITNDDGIPIWVEYDKDGKVIEDGECQLSVSQPISAPHLAGSTKADAIGSITGAGLVVGKVSYQFSDDYQNGLVMAQAPVSGETVPEDSCVNITVSLGKKFVTETFQTNETINLSETGVQYNLGINVVSVDPRPEEYLSYSVSSSTLKMNIDSKGLDVIVNSVNHGPQSGAELKIENFEAVTGLNTLTLELINGAINLSDPPVISSLELEAELAYDTDYSAFVQVPFLFMNDFNNDSETIIKNVNSLGLAYGGYTTIDSLVEKGRVASQSLPGGDWVKAGSVLNVNVSTGEKGGVKSGRLGLAENELEGAMVMAAMIYKEYVNSFYRIQKENSGQWEILTKDEYETRNFLLADDNAYTGKPAIKSADTYHLVVRKKSALLSVYDDLVLMECPINLQRIQPINIDETVDEKDQIKSLLLHKNERYVLFLSKNNIGYKSAYYSVDSKWDGEYQDRTLGGYDPENDQLWAPLGGILVTPSFTVAGMDFSDVTKENGNFFLQYLVPGCCGFDYIFDNRISAEISFVDFNPKQKRGYLSTYAWRNVTESCLGLSSTLSLTSLAAIMMRMSMMNQENEFAMEQTARQLATQMNFTIDVAWITGRAEFVNEYRPGIGAVNHGAIPQGTTTQYDSETTPPDVLTENTLLNTSLINLDLDGDGYGETVRFWKRQNTWVLKVWYSSNENPGQDPDRQWVYFKEPTAAERVVDLDGDGEDDTVEVEQTVFASEKNEYYADVWFAGSDPNTEPPDVIRLGDDSFGTSAMDLFDRGLVKFMSVEDLEDTDIYIVRESNGQLITRRKGLGVSDAGATGAVNDIDTSKSQISYRVKTRGPGILNIQDELIQVWGARSELNEDLCKREADHLRPGENVNIVLLNRATGYMGKSSVTMGDTLGSKTSTGLLNISPPTIRVRPPNLKIHSERTWIVDGGATGGEMRDNVIGFEGSGLVSDVVIKVTTEWYDWDGTVLPDEISGYTGRIAKVVAQDILGNDGGENVGHFEIKPGTHTQIIKLPKGSADDQKAHYYIQVSGESLDGNPDFETLDAGGGILSTRPAHYVPVKVRVFDEKATRAAEALRRELIKKEKEDNPNYIVNTEDFPEVKPIYRWVYRPEMQFSLFELDVESTALIDKEKRGENPLDQNGQEPEYISYVDFLYTFLEPALDPLESYQADKDLVLSINGREFLLDQQTIGDNATLDALYVPGSVYYDEANSTDMLYRIAGVNVFDDLAPEDFLTLRVYQNGDDYNVLWELEFAPLIQANPENIVLTRSVQESRFEPEERKFIDKPYIVKFKMLSDAVVRVNIRDASERVVQTYIEETDLKKDDEKLFYLDYSIIEKAGIEYGQPFYVDLEAREKDNSYSRKIRYEGKQYKDMNGTMLGQIMAHDVLIQDGSLNLSRQDFSIQGRGPGIEFSRSYNNNSSDSLSVSPLGNGWNHSLDKRLTAYEGLKAQWTTEEGLQPDWSKDIKTARAFIPKDDLAKNEEWILIQVNGTCFLKDGGAWKAERGRHGKLEELTEDGKDFFVFVAKDGTRYTYPKPKYIWNKLEQGEQANRSTYPIVGVETLREIKDRNGNTLTFDYVHPDKTWDPTQFVELKSVTDSVGRQFYFSYQNVNVTGVEGKEFVPRLVKAEGPVTSVDDLGGSANIVVDYEYNDKGYLSKVSRKGGRVEIYEYDVKEKDKEKDRYNLVRVIKSMDSQGLEKVYAYTYNKVGDFDSLVNIKWIQEPWNTINTVSYPTDTNEAPVIAQVEYNNPSSSKRTVIDPKGNQTVYTLNNYGNPLSIAEPLGKTTAMTWSINEGKPDNVMTSKTVSKTVNGSDTNVTTTYVYDGRGNVTSETTGAHVITSTWNHFSQPTYKKDITGVEQHWEYDPVNGNLLNYTDGNGNRFTNTYYTTGEVETSTFGGTTSTPSVVTAYTYDTHGNPATVKKPLAPAEVYVYDIRGRLRSARDPNGQLTTYTYDALDYPDITTYPLITPEDGNTHLTRIVDKDYDAEGNLLKENDRNGLVVTYAYTARNQVEKITRAAGGEKIFDYDPNGNLLSETDWKGKPTRHSYNELNQRTITTNRMHVDMTMTYDAGGNLATQTDYEGRITSYLYDILDRPTSETIEKNNAVVARTTRAYAIGSLDGISGYVETQTTDVDGTRNIETKLLYDGQGNVIRKQVTGLDTWLHKWQYGPLKNLEWEEDEEGHTVTFAYDNAGRLKSTTRPYSGLSGSHDFVTDYAYDDNGNRIKETVHNVKGDIETTMDYDAWNRPVAVHLTDSHDGGTYTTRTHYDGMGNVVKTIDARNVPRIQERDVLGRLTRTEDGTGKITRYTDYDLNGNLVSMTVDDIVTVVNTYYDNDLLKHTTESDLIAGGSREKGDFLYDTMGNLIQATDYKGNTVKTDYNGLYLPWKIYAANSDSIFTETRYTKTGWATSVTDRRGMTTTYEYDDFGRVTEQLPPMYSAQPIVTTYDKVGNVKTVTDRRGIETVNTYDSFNRLETVTRAGLLISTTTYDDLGNVLSVTDAKNNATEYQYNDRNLLVKTVFPRTPSDGSHTDVSELRKYDGNGNLTEFTDKDERVTTTTYDHENRPVTVTFANEKTTNVYDIAGNLITVIRPKTNKRAMNYDGFGRLVGVIDDPDTLNLTTRYLYDANNNPEHVYVQSNNSGGESHVAYAYDDQNRKIRHTQHRTDGPDLVTTFDEYDNEGNLKKMTDPMGRSFTYDYDDLGRQTDAHDPTTGSPYHETTHVQTDYDANNNVTRIIETKSDGAGSFTDITENTVYDEFDRLKTSIQRGQTLHYDYDDNGNRTRVSSDAGTTTYTYDERNRLASATQGTDTTTYTYYRDGKKDTVTYPNGTRQVTTYYNTNRVQAITNTLIADSSAISSFSYTYDANGNRMQQIEIQNGLSETTGYVYDTLDRMTDYTLTDSSGVTTHTAYTFAAYNRKTETVTTDGTVTKARTYTYNDVNWLTKIDDTTNSANPFTIDYAFDKNGNTIYKSDSSLTDQDTTFTYDSRNQLVQTTRGPPASLEILGQYDYNASGLRVRHRHSERGNVDYFYDGPAVLEERNADDDSLLAHYRYADRLLSLSTGADVQYYHHDALGSTVNLTNEDGSVRMRYWLDPYGQIRKQEGTSVNRMVFTGQEHDEKTGLIYFGARYYDPDIARFITQDSYLGEQGVPPSLHRYLYAYANPTVYIDLYGYYSWNQFKKDAKNFYDVVKPSGKLAKSLPTIMEGVGQLPVAVDKQLMNQSTLGPGTSAALYTAVTVFSGITSAPAYLGNEGATFTADPTMLNIPVLGDVADNGALALSDYMDNPTDENYWRVVSAGCEGFLVVAGPASLAKGRGKPKITIEDTGGRKTVVPKAVGADVLDDNPVPVMTRAEYEARLKPGDVMTSREYKAKREVGSTLRGHHTPQAQRLKGKGLDPDDGTVVVVENKLEDSSGNKLGHTGTRTYGGKGSKTAKEESGKSLAYSEKFDLEDPPVKQLGEETANKIKELNRKNFPEHYEE